MLRPSQLIYGPTANTATGQANRHQWISSICRCDKDSWYIRPVDTSYHNSQFFHCTLRPMIVDKSLKQIDTTANSPIAQASWYVGQANRHHCQFADDTLRPTSQLIHGLRTNTITGQAFTCCDKSQSIHPPISESTTQDTPFVSKPVDTSTKPI